jgi:hypothetical protein
LRCSIKPPGGKSGRDGEASTFLAEGGTAALALDARLRLIPNLTDANLSGLAWHIRSITTLAIAFVVVGGLIRLGGLG